MALAQFLTKFKVAENGFNGKPKATASGASRKRRRLRLAVKPIFRNLENSQKLIFSILASFANLSAMT